MQPQHYLLFLAIVGLAYADYTVIKNIGILIRNRKTHEVFLGALIGSISLAGCVSYLLHFATMTFIDTLVEV